MKSLIPRGEAIHESSLFFLAGFLSCFLLISFSAFGLLATGTENPLGFGFSGVQYNNASSPGDWVKTSQIALTENSIVIKIPNASLSSYAPTGSMKPVFDSGANGIRIIPNSAEDINVGDIITYGNENIVHRVIETGIDENGYWFMAKGDNNVYADSQKIRFEDIRYVTIGILY